MAAGTGSFLIGLAERPQQLKLKIAVGAEILIDGHLPSPMN
jgi:hypothetical protein